MPARQASLGGNPQLRYSGSSDGGSSLTGPADDDPAAPATPAAVYRGPPARAGRFVVRSTFGGLGDGFVASGSECCAVYVWRAADGELLHKLEGHSGTVNAVAWNPAHPGMLVSASDDRSVHVWGIPEEGEEEGEEDGVAANGGSGAR